MLLDADHTRLEHMVEAAREAIGYVEGLDRSDLGGNRPLQHSLVRCIEVIGEAAARLTRAFRESHPDVPWQDMIAMRNRLIHAYFDIDLDVIWRTACEELPGLIGRLESCLSEMRPS